MTALFIHISVVKLTRKGERPLKRLKVLKLGSILLKVFLLLCCVFGAVYLYDYLKAPLGFSEWSTSRAGFIIKLVLVILLCSLVFWTGIIIVYITCNQLRLKKRVLGLLLGLIPIANLIMLTDIIVTADREYRFECEKLRLNESRAADRICATKYPVLLVHGVFFRDFRLINYWGRIPRELEANGAAVFYGEHNSASSVAASAEQLKSRLLEITEKTGCEKVNIIAHSKGGLDVRKMLADDAARERVASLITINTPHRGCKFADYLFEKVPERMKNAIARTYNAAAEKLGDTEPDFLAATFDLTAARCKALNAELADPDGVYCASVGSVQRRATSGRFPLNMTHFFVKLFDGENDGLVGAESFGWGESLTMLRPKGRRGISHGDMIDLNRENIRGFDVREFYVQLVADLKRRGL